MLDLIRQKFILIYNLNDIDELNQKFCYMVILSEAMTSMSNLQLNTQEQILIGDLTKVMTQVKNGRVGFITKYKFIEACDSFLNELNVSQNLVFKQEAQTLLQSLMNYLKDGQKVNLMSSLLYSKYYDKLETVLIDFEKQTLEENIHSQNSEQNKPTSSKMKI
jgi:hypothetical protein